MTLQYCGGDARQAASVFGWGRHTVELGLAERRTGILCLGAQSACSGRTRWEAEHPDVAEALWQLAESHAQHAPTFRTSVASTRLTAQAAREELRAQGDDAAQLPAPSTMAQVLNRLGFRLRKVVTATPQKKLKATDAIFDTIKKKMTTRTKRATSNACVSLVKRRCALATGRVVVSPGVITTPGIMTWGARRRTSRVGLWMKIPGT